MGQKTDQNHSLFMSSDSSHHNVENLDSDSISTYNQLDNFVGKYEWLSLDYKCDIYFKEKFYPSAYHALMAAQFGPSITGDILQCPDVQELRKFLDESPPKASDEWLKFRYKWMDMIQRDKFRRHPDLREKLQQTGGRKIAWSNKTDTFFGEVNLKGQNNLGRILMSIRNDVNKDTDLKSWLAVCNDLEPDLNLRPIVLIKEYKDGIEEKTHVLQSKPFYGIGKLPENDIVAFNPSVSRRHAAIVIFKGGKVMVMDLNSKAGTYRNSEKLFAHHVAIPVQFNDKIRLGMSTRYYLIEINSSNLLHYYERKQKELEREIHRLDTDFKDPFGIMTKCSNQVCVRGLTPKTSIEDLRDFFRICGQINDIKLPDRGSNTRNILDSETYAKRGIAFVTFSKASEASAALERNEVSLNGKVVKVSYADKQQVSEKKGREALQDKSQIYSSDSRRHDRDSSIQISRNKKNFLNDHNNRKKIKRRSHSSSVDNYRRKDSK